MRAPIGLGNPARHLLRVIAWAAKKAEDRNAAAVCPIPRLLLQSCCEATGPFGATIYRCCTLTGCMVNANGCIPLR